jgi:hypothetical protein
MTRLVGVSAMEGLPFELLIRIVNFSRPNSFESLMLSSKTIYEAGSVLIEDHNFCKRWEDCDYIPECRADPHRHLHTTSTTSIFRKILETPRNVRPWILEYRSKVFLSRFASALYDPELMSRVRSELPWIGNEFLRMMAQFPGPFRDFESSNNLARFFEGRDATLCEGEIGALCAFLLLLLCSNTQSLIIEAFGSPLGSACISLLSQLDRHEIGHIILPDLSSVIVYGPRNSNDNMHLETAESLLSLQRIQSLELHELATVAGPFQDATFQVPTSMSSETLKTALPLLRQLILKDRSYPHNTSLIS